MGSYNYVIAWFAVVFRINSMSNAEIIVRGAGQSLCQTKSYNSHMNTSLQFCGCKFHVFAFNHE